MPIWFELIMLLLATYALGIVIGWAFWGREITAMIGSKSPADDNEEETF
ncbi:hypothetical protein [Pontixanthobacter aquaemixtae]|uniref:Uncharacterized protein n=1 Tax=Pontixanthobacter aquaemixtae TaxID=1958940 RepID=A0A844ZUM6_9SPHN|nr:hypothetical protein [Pontixanthobacter aquaemixtae]MXO90830.1 hypothetical protein [Pontixanthobacter aquaemixtae]